MRVSKPEHVLLDREHHLRTAFDIGPTRTLQQDVEFGIIQIVDIALRAMSPAVNDPSTAISCVDQLSRILILWIRRRPPPSHYYAPPHVLRLVVPWIDFEAGGGCCGKFAINSRSQRHRGRQRACRRSYEIA
jgi:uncharacterized membrane protein